MDNLRTPLLLLAIFLVIVIVGVELGSTLISAPIPGQATDLLPPEERDVAQSVKPGQTKAPPGLGIPYMALVDGIVLFTAALIGSSLVVSKSAQARVQGCATTIFSLIIIISALVMIFTAIALVILMVALLISVPFGTIIYLIIYGFFNTGSASAILSLLMMLKIGFLVCLLAANQRFLQNKGLILILLTSLLANVIVSILHGLVPGFLVSITDAIAAIIVAILAVIWAIILLIGSIGSITKALKPAV